MFRNVRESKLVNHPRSELLTKTNNQHKLYFYEYSGDEEQFYADIDVDSIVGKQLLMWSYQMPETLAIYTPLSGDNLSHLTQFANSILHFNNLTDKLMVLKPKREKLVSILDIYRVKHGSCIIIMPKHNPTITLEIRQLNTKFDIVISMATTVKDLKYFLQRKKCYLQDRIELLYKDEPLANDKHLFEYKICHKSHIFVMLHLYYDLLIHVECFWGQTYHLYVDPCMTGNTIISMILKRTVSPNIKDVMTFFELFLPKSTLILCHKNCYIKLHECIGLYVNKESTVTLTTVAIFNKSGMQQVPVTVDEGTTMTFAVSKFDSWSTVALQIHGVTREPMNYIRLYKAKHEIDMSEMIGGPWDGNFCPKISYSLTHSQIDIDTLYGIELCIMLGGKISETIRCAANRRIKTVTERLQTMGVPNATVYDLFLGSTKLPKDGKIEDNIVDARMVLCLKLKSFPVFINSPQTVIYKMFAHAHESLATFKVRIQMKTGLSIKHFDLMMSGEIIAAEDDTLVFDTKIAAKTSIFMVPKETSKTFIILADDWLVKVRVPRNHIYKQIEEILQKESNLPEGSLYSITNFFLWFYQKTDRKKLPNSKTMYDPFAIGGPQATVGLPGYQWKQMKELRQEKHNKSMIVVHGKQQTNKFPYKPDTVCMDKAGQLEIKAMHLNN